MSNTHDAADKGNPPQDLEWGAFTIEGPWNLNLEEATWMPAAQRAREQYAKELSRYTKAPRRPPLKRGVVVVWTLGRAIAAWKVKKTFRRHKGPQSKTVLAQELRKAFESLGVTYIKLAQIISAGEGLFGKELTDELKKCRDQVPGESFATVKETIESGLGMPLNSLFKPLNGVQ